MNPYADLANFLLAHIKPETVLYFRATEEQHDHFYQLLEKEKNGVATAEDIDTISKFMQVEHIMRLAKAKARQHVHQ